MSGPLDGIRVLDLTSVVLGPWATLILGDMGADVIKVEAPEGDITRGIGPARNPGMAATYLNCNRNKRAIALDLKRPAAREALLKLVETADVFVHSIRPQAVDRLGPSYDSLAAVNPRIVYAAAYGYRRDGPYGHKPAFDDMIQGAAGLALLQARLTGAPRYLPTIVADKSVALALVGNIAMALFHRERTGAGQHVETTMFETMTAFTMVEHLFGEVFRPAEGTTGYPRVLADNRRPYRTKDGYIGVLPYNDRQFRAFFAVAGRPELADDPRFATAASRLAHIDELYGELGQLVAARTSVEWLEALDAANIPSTAINQLDELIDDPHLKAVGFWRDESHPTEGDIRMTDVMAKFSKSPGAVRRHAPGFGEHTREILAEAGLGDAEIEAMIEAGAALDRLREGEGN